MTKILMVDSYAGFGGGQTIVKNLVSGLSADFDITVWAPDGPMLAVYKKNGAKVESAMKKGFLGQIFALRACLLVNSYDIVHVHGTRAAFWVRLAYMLLSKNKRPKLVYTVHGFHLVHKKGIVKKFVLAIEKLLNKFVHSLVVVSKSDKKFIESLNLIKKSKIVHIANGVSVPEIKEEDIERLRKKFEVVEDDFNIVSVARLHPQKDIATLIVAFSKFLKFNQRTKLFLIGDGPDKEMLTNLVQTLEISNKVVFVGRSTLATTWMALSDVVVLSTKWEGLPLVPLEAGLLQKPFIGTDIFGICDIVKHHKNGFLFDVGDDNALAQLFINVYKDRKKADNIAEKLYNSVVQKFNVTTMINKHKDLYETIYND